MTATFKIFANGIFWGQWEAETAEEAMQIAADEVGTIDVGQEHASIEGLTAKAKLDECIRKGGNGMRQVQQ